MAKAKQGEHNEKMESPMVPWRNMMIVAALCIAARQFSGATEGKTAEGDGIFIDGAQFPAELKMGGVVQQLTGGGTRTKYNVAKVYAVALYLDSRGAASSLKQFAGKKPAVSLYTSLVKGNFAKTLYLQFHRSVTAETVAQALSESLSKRLPEAVVEKFKAALLTVCPAEVARGTKLFFMCKGEALMMGAGSADVRSTLKEKGACSALFDVYLGKAPISPAAKEGIGAGFAQRLYVDAK